eukprot:TRINITY_DN4911_c0_g1_i1.p1 TRINITY_DN4911_c0_g1~~TRINITY_DN4911_c0_g1_i1.p1  ORF type:complete len:524 (+),score=73.83 TRINITY_DN4911_c0_g1_i1:27-1574(+)
MSRPPKECIGRALLILALRPPHVDAIPCYIINIILGTDSSYLTSPKAPAGHLLKQQLADNKFLDKIFEDLAQTTAPIARFDALLWCRRVLSLEDRPQDVCGRLMERGIGPLVTPLLSEENKPTWQYEAAWVVTNLASATSVEVEYIIEHGCLAPLVVMLDHKDPEFSAQAAWALGNIAGDGVRFRDQVLGIALVSLLRLIAEQVLPQWTAGNRTSQIIQLARHTTWSLSNFVRGKPQPDFQRTAAAIPILASIISNIIDDEVQADALWAMSYLSDGPNEQIQRVIDAGALPLLVQRLSHQSYQSQTPALRAVGNILSGDDAQTDQVLLAGGLVPLTCLLGSPKRAIQREACWAISNILAGPRHQIQQCLEVQEPALLPKLVSMASGEGVDNTVQKEAICCLSNMCSGASNEQRIALNLIGGVPVLVETLKSPDVQNLQRAVEALGHLAKVEELREDIKQLIESDDSILELQEHPRVGVDFTSLLSVLGIESDVEEEEDGKEEVSEIEPQGFAFPN